MCSSLLPKDKDKAATLDKGRLSRPYKYFVGHRFDSDSSSSSEEEEHFASPPPNKRTRMKRRKGRVVPVDNSSDTPISECPESQSMNDPSNEAEQSKPEISANLSKSSNDDTEKEEIALAKTDRLDKVNNLQSFDRDDWKDKEYKSVLQKYLATPGFVALKVNKELCDYMKTEDSLISTENILAGLTNIEMEREELMKEGLQNIVDWAATSSDELNSSTLSEKLLSLVGEKSPVQSCSEKILQIICGRRAECINIRRESIIKNIKSPMVKGLLGNIPPSSEYLFNQDSLIPVLKTLAETEVLLNKRKCKRGTEQKNVSKISHTSINKKRSQDLRDKQHNVKAIPKDKKVSESLSERAKSYRRLKPKHTQSYRSSSEKTD